MLLQEHCEALGVSILTNHVTGSVSVAVLRIVICSLGKQRLQYLGVTTDASHVQRCSQVLGLAIDVGVELGKDLDHLDVAFIAGDVEWGPPIRVALVKQSLGKFGFLLEKEVIAQLIVALLGVDPDVAEEASLLLLVELTLGLDPCGHLLLLRLLI